MNGQSLKPKQSISFQTIYKILILILFGYMIYLSFTYDGEESSKKSTHQVLINGANVVDIIIDNKDDYNITFSDIFYVNIGEEKVCGISFLNANQYKDYLEYAKFSNLTTLLEQNSNYVFYLDTIYNENNYVYVIKIEGLDYIAKLNSKVSKEQAETCYNKISFKVK